MTDVKIIKPCKTAMSSGSSKTKKWTLKFDEASEKYKENLMGWIGTSDNRYQMRLQFETREAAIAFAEKHGLSYVVEEPHEPRPILKNYGDNFSARLMKG